jgi:hypothetical protein
MSRMQACIHGLGVACNRCREARKRNSPELQEELSESMQKKVSGLQKFIAENLIDIGRILPGTFSPEQIRTLENLSSGQETKKKKTSAFRSSRSRAKRTISERLSGS